jgi:hypothetical protein
MSKTECGKMLGQLLLVVVEETTTVCRVSRIEGWVLRERKDGGWICVGRKRVRGKMGEVAFY